MYSRGLKSIEITPEVREFGLDESVTELAPTELISAILKAPVDLIYNGGIGTYVKAPPRPTHRWATRLTTHCASTVRDLRAKMGEVTSASPTGRIEVKPQRRYPLTIDEAAHEKRRGNTIESEVTV